MAGGRPTKYNPEQNEQARKLCLLGATDRDLADFFSIQESTLNEWKKKKQGFSESIKLGRLKADAEVGLRLYERAVGFEWDEVQPIKLKEVMYEGGKRVKEVERVQLVEVHRVIPPDTTAIIYWTKNRQPKYWRDRQEIDHTNNGKDFGLSAGQAEQLIRARANRRNPE